MKPASPYLKLRDAADYLGLTPAAFYSFLYRRKAAGFPVKTYHLGKSLRFKQVDLDAAMEVTGGRKQRQLSTCSDRSRG